MRNGAGDVWPNEVDLVTSSSDSHLEPLRLARNGIDPFGADPKYDVEVATGKAGSWNGIIRSSALCVDLPFPLPTSPWRPFPGLPHVCAQRSATYEPIRKAFVDAGYVPGQTLFAFAYDWRRGARWNAAGAPDSLLAKIDEVLAETKAASVDIVAHSQGGLVTRALLDDARSVGKVRRVATIGTPYLGTPKFLTILQWAKPCQIGGPVGICLSNPKMVQSLVQNFPGSMQLLPSRRYFAAVAKRPVELTYDRDGDGEREGPLSFDETIDLLERSGRNMNLISQAGSLHHDLEPWSPADPDVEVLRVAGRGYGTIAGAKVHRRAICVRATDGGEISCGARLCNLIKCRRTTKLVVDYAMGSGDKTVIRASAALRDCERGYGGLQGDPDRSFTVFREKVEHLELTQDEQVQGWVIDFLRNGHEPTRCPGTGSFRRATAGAAAEEDGDAGLYGTELVVHGPLLGNVADAEGNVTGNYDTETGIELELIPGSTFTAGDGSQSIFTTEDSPLSGIWTATGSGDVDVRINAYEADEVAASWVSPLFDVAEGARVELDYAQPAGIEAPVLEIDDDADGTPDRTVALAGPLQGDAATDSEPPVSTVSVTRFVQDGKRLARLELAATDAGGSGVDRIEWSADAVGESGVYAEPFVVPAKGEVYVRAVDRAGNVESEWRVGLVDDHPSELSHVTAFRSAPLTGAGLLAYAGDVDWWGVEVTQRDRYRLLLHGLRLDARVSLHDAAGAVIASSDRPLWHPESLEATLEPGRYLLRVAASGDAFDERWPYLLDFRRQ
jgi:pimeloyl-ACP methyl ester carboxylesterase